MDEGEGALIVLAAAAVCDRGPADGTTKLSAAIRGPGGEPIQVRLPVCDARELYVERGAEDRHLQGLRVKTGHEMPKRRRCYFHLGVPLR